MLKSKPTCALDLTLSELPLLPTISVWGTTHVTSGHFPQTSTQCILVKSTIVALWSEVSRVVRKVLVLELCPILEAMPGAHVILFLRLLVWGLCLRAHKPALYVHYAEATTTF